MLAGQGESTVYIYNGISSSVHIEKVFYTQSASKSTLIKNRIKRLGFFKVMNQLCFQVFITRFLQAFSKNIIHKRIKELKLDNTPIPQGKVIHVGGVNSDKTIEELKKINPDVVLVNGTAIIKKKVLESINAIFINTHVGITPQYRGVHGGYWALRNQDPENFGVTVHKVDTGIDTGDIIYQKTCSINKKDNFITYPLIQTALAIPLLIKTFEDIQEGKLKTYKKENAPSHLYYHPTSTTYLWGFLKYGIK